MQPTTPKPNIQTIPPNYEQFEKYVQENSKAQPAKFTYTVKYVDSPGYTVPCLLTEERVKKFLDDASVEEVELQYGGKFFERFLFLNLNDIE